MARLPKPGGDAGSWGDVLNDFLSQEHNADGSLKVRAVIDQARQDIATLQTDKADQAAVNALTPQQPGEVVVGGASSHPVSVPHQFNVKAFGAMGNGSADDTAAIQATITAATSGGTVYIPPGTYLVSARLTLTGNQRLRLAPGATLKFIATVNQQAMVYVGPGITDVEICGGGTLDGNRANNPTGQLFGIQVYSNCARITIHDIHIKSFPADVSGGNWGDGIYIGTSAGSGLVPQDVSVQNCVIEDNVRQGISITAGQHVRVSGNSIINTVGSAPGAAVDIEPNNTADLCADITISGNTFADNFHGVQVTGSAVSRVAISGNTIMGKGDNSTDGSGNPSYGIYTATTASDVTATGNVIRSVSQAFSLSGPRTIVVGNKVSGCRIGVQLSCDHGIIEGNSFDQTWGEWAIRVQAHEPLIIGNQFYNCLDSARLAGLSVAPVAVITCNDGWLHGTIANNLLHDDRTTNVAPTGMRLSSQVTEQATWLITGNRILGIPTTFANITAAQAFTEQTNVAAGSGSVLLGQLQGNLLSTNTASVETDASGWGSPGGCTAAQSNDVALAGNFALKLTATTTGPTAARIDSATVTSVLVGQSYTGMVHYHTTVAGEGIQCQLYGVDGGGVQQPLGATNGATVAGGWQKLTITATLPAGYQSKLFLRVRFSPATIGEVLYLDGAAILPGFSKLWQHAGQVITEIGPTGIVLGGTSAADQPLQLAAKNGGAIWLNRFGGAGGTVFGDGAGTVVAKVDAAGAIYPQNRGPKLMAGAGNPEGVVVAPIGSLYLRTDGGSGTSLYVKETGTGAAGWVGK